MIDRQPAYVVERIYEASVVPALWPTALQGLADLVHASGAAIMSERDGDVQFRSTNSLTSLMQIVINNAHLGRHGSIFGRMSNKNYSGFVTDGDLFSRDELFSLPIFKDSLRPHGYGSGAGLLLRMPNDDIITVVLVKRAGQTWSDAQLAQLEKVRPHLARAVYLSSRVGLEAARASSQAMEEVGLPAAVIGHNGVVLVANDLFAPLLPDTFVFGTSGRLSLTDSLADREWQTIVSGASSAFSSHDSFSIPVQGDDRHSAMVIHVLPVTGAAADIFVGGESIIIVTPVAPVDPPEPRVIAALFDLTPLEARVATLRATACTVPDIADALSITEDTVKSQVRSLSKKLGISGQADITRLIMGRNWRRSRV